MADQLSGTQISLPKVFTKFSSLVLIFPRRRSKHRSSYEQRHFYFCLKHYKTRCTPEKLDRIKNPRHGQHPERDQNEIGTRYEFAYFEAIKGQDRVACQYRLGFSLLEGHLETPIKRDARLKNEIGRNLGK